jgi:hypothetical protein
MPSATSKEAVLPQTSASKWASAITDRVNGDTRIRPWKNAITQHRSYSERDEGIISLDKPNDNGAVA